MKAFRVEGFGIEVGQFVWLQVRSCLRHGKQEAAQPAMPPPISLRVSPSGRDPPSGWPAWEALHTDMHGVCIETAHPALC